MHPNNLNVFDLDGTLIRVNSFREISKKLVQTLFFHLSLIALGSLVYNYLLRQLHIITHLQFKRRVVNVFERCINEKEKKSIVQKVFQNNINQQVFSRMLKSENCVISTASPYAYTSRMNFPDHVIIISSLEPQDDLPDSANFGTGKIENLKRYFQRKEIRVVNFYTDSADDQALVDISLNAFIFKDDQLIKIK